MGPLPWGGEVRKQIHCAEGQVPEPVPFCTRLHPHQGWRQKAGRKGRAAARRTGQYRGTLPSQHLPGRHQTDCHIPSIQL